MTEEKLREAIKKLGKLVQRSCGGSVKLCISENEANAIEDLLLLARSYLQAGKDVPEEKIIGTDEFKCGGCGECEACKHYKQYGQYEDNGFNTCRSQMLALLVARDRENRDIAHRLIELSNENTCLKAEIKRFRSRRAP